MKYLKFYIRLDNKLNKVLTIGIVTLLTILMLPLINIYSGWQTSEDPIGVWIACIFLSFITCGILVSLITYGLVYFVSWIEDTLIPEFHNAAKMELDFEPKKNKSKVTFG